jgi:PhzF family phenazine biosynthesis protein
MAKMKLPIYQVDAFTRNLFGGNPAAVCPLDKWLPDQVMQNIAMENNLAETAFFVPVKDSFEIRWFTPLVEIDLCGHATLASAHVLFNHQNYRKDKIRFISKSGELVVTQNDELLTLNFPAAKPAPITPPPGLVEALGHPPTETHKARDLFVVYNSEKDIKAINPNFELLRQINAHAFIVTAPGIDCDFVSRFFAPHLGINEDTVTGSAHTALIPFWAERLGKNKMYARQLSKRQGELFCEHLGDRVLISGRAVTYFKGEITL